MTAEHAAFLSRFKNLAYGIHDLTSCDTEPLPFCGAIQPCGHLIALSRGNIVRALSSNWQDILPRPLSSYIDIPLTEDFGLTQAFASTRPDEIVSYHTIGDLTIVEIEPSIGATTIPETRAPSALMTALQDLDGTIACAETTAQFVKNISGYDRVMVYQFDPVGNGQIVAEAREPHLEPFLKLRYPASDIPPQARRLFLLNPLRMIVDVNADPIPLVGGSVLLQDCDLSRSVLRAVSPMHLQYLTNMGVRATFVVALLVQQKLWGMLVCHHYSAPRQPSATMRDNIVLMGQLLSGKIRELSLVRKFKVKASTFDFAGVVMDHIEPGKDPFQDGSTVNAKLLNLISSSAVLIKSESGELVIGKSPTDQTLQAVVTYLSKLPHLTPWCSNAISTDLGIAPDEHAAGALAVPLSPEFQSCIVWFRPEEVAEHLWAGDPTQSKVSATDIVARLTPRGSFATWSELVRNHSEHWSEEDLEFAHYFMVGLMHRILAKAQRLSHDFRGLEEESRAKDSFINTVSHELRTPLSIMIGWIDLLKHQRNDPAVVAQAIDIIDRSAETQLRLIDDLLDLSRIMSGKMRIDAEPNVDVTSIISDIFGTFSIIAQSKQIRLSFGRLEPVTPVADPTRLRQIVSNLLNNALKFTPKGGSITISLTATTNEYAVVVKDTGIGLSPENLELVFQPFRQITPTNAQVGLGLGLSIARQLVTLHGGTITATSKGLNEGTTFTVTLPIVPSEFQSVPPSAPTISKASLTTSKALAGKRILILEDHPEMSLYLRNVCERHGATVAVGENGVVGLDLLQHNTFDLLISDLNMPEVDGYDLIHILRSKETAQGKGAMPAIALTAYASSSDRVKVLKAGFQSHVSKPVNQD